MKTALQIYTLRNTILKNTAEQLRELKFAGYDGIELLDLGENSMATLTDEMERIGLAVFSIHIGVEDMLRMDEGQLAQYAAMGCRMLTISYLPPERIAGGALYGETLALISAYAALAAKHGIRILYHNHEFDLDMHDGKRKLDILYADIAPEVLHAELDTCWLYTGGADPLAYLEKYAGRCPVLHLKDCVAEGGRKGLRALGEGVIDFHPILSRASACGVEWLCVEQDEPSPGKTPMECALESIRFLERNL